MGFTGNSVRDRSLLGALLQRLGLPLPLVSLLLAHARAVADAGERLGLISPGDLDSIVTRHTADSLLFALARRPEADEHWVDVGSGAGFPGLVLACAYPDARFTLVEPNARRAGFLELLVAGLGLANVEVTPLRLEEAHLEGDVAVARAFRNPEEALLTLRSAVRPGGTMIVAAGSDPVEPPGARTIRLESIDDVDSPGVLFMMSQEA